MSDNANESEEDSDKDDEEQTHLDRVREAKLVLETMRTAAKLVEMLR